MTIWLLSHLVDSPGNALLLESAAKRGLAVRHVNPNDVSLRVGGGSPSVIYDASGEEVELPTWVFTRMGSSAPARAGEVLRQLESLGVRGVNSADSLDLARDKVLSFQRLAAAGLPLPATLVLGREAPLDKLIPALGEPPWVVKLPIATQGKGVVLAESLSGLRSLLDLASGLSERALVQAFVRESKGADLRVLVVKGEAIAGMRRQARAGEFRSNLHRGGGAQALELDPQLVDLAQRAAAALDLGVAGVDLLPSCDGPVIAEVNSSPGLEGLSRATGRDLADEVWQRLA